jgi:hypothetical protein
MATCTTPIRNRSPALDGDELLREFGLEYNVFSPRPPQMYCSSSFHRTPARSIRLGAALTIAAHPFTIPLNMMDNDVFQRTELERALHSLNFNALDGCILSGDDLDSPDSRGVTPLMFLYRVLTTLDAFETISSNDEFGNVFEVYEAMKRLIVAGANVKHLQLVAQQDGNQRVLMCTEKYL